MNRLVKQRSDSGSNPLVDCTVVGTPCCFDILLGPLVGALVSLKDYADHDTIRLNEIDFDADYSIAGCPVMGLGSYYTLDFVVLHGRDYFLVGTGSLPVLVDWKRRDTSLWGARILDETHSRVVVVEPYFVS